MDASTTIGWGPAMSQERADSWPSARSGSVVTLLPSVPHELSASERLAGHWQNRPEPSSAVRVGVVDRDPGFAVALGNALEDEAGLCVVGTASAVSTGHILARAGLDLMLIDCRLPEPGAPELARIALRERPSLEVVGLSSRLDRAARSALVAVGAVGAVDRSMALEDLAMVVLEAFGSRSSRRLAYA